MQAAEAAQHRAQRAWIRGYAPAHLAARQTVLVHVAADAVCCESSLSTAMEITMNGISCTVSDVSKGLTKSSNGDGHIQLAPSAAVQAALHMQLQQLRRLPHPSAGMMHCGRGRQPSFRQPSKARGRRMNSSGPVRAHLKASPHGEHGEAHQPQKEPSMTSSKGGTRDGAVGFRFRPT